MLVQIVNVKRAETPLDELVVETWLQEGARLDRHNVQKSSFPYASLPKHAEALSHEVSG